MPTKRKRRERFRRPEIDPVHWAMLTDSPIPEDSCPFAYFTFRPDVARTLWDIYRERILSDWLECSPGTRPQHWWKFEAPRAEDTTGYEHCAGLMIQPRKLLKGRGIPAWERLCLLPAFHLGIPHFWTGGDPNKLVFESQHDYLLRHGLLEAGEGESIEPVFIPRDWRT